MTSLFQYLAKDVGDGLPEFGWINNIMEAGYNGISEIYEKGLETA